MRVLDSGVLSRFLGVWHEDFFGGPEVQALEKEWATFFQVKHAISVNSATSGLFAAAGAAGVGPGDEVIVSPYTMSASATAPLIYGAIPVFADIEEDHFCLDPKSIEEKITKYTKAIVVVDIFGQPYDADTINEIAKKHNLIVIEDAAQAPAGKYKDKWTGTLADMGVFSLNYHKHIHTGEGGIIVTDNDELADRLRLIRNHAESVVEAKQVKNLNNMVGYNYRMTELEASLAREQLKKLPKVIEDRQKTVSFLAEKLGAFPFLSPAPARNESLHSYYVHPIKYFKEKADEIPRDVFIEAVRAELPLTELRETEGVNLGGGYVKPLYLQPMYQKRMAFGDSGFPWNSKHYQGSVSYEKGICPVTEKMHYEELFTNQIIHPEMTESDLMDIVNAFAKVWENRSELL